MHPTSPPPTSAQELSFAVPAESGAGYITDPDEQPFSPSVFLNLPPTPPHDGEDPAASSDSIVPPFILRILMDDDDKLSYEYPDHQALLQAQQPFAEILSNTTTTTTTNTNLVTNTFRRIRRDGFTTGDHDHANTTFFAEQDNYTASMGQFIRRHDADMANMDNTITTPGRAGAGVGEHSSSLFFGTGQMIMTQVSKVTMGMLINQAFHKGMEEATKFLPTTTNILLPIHSNAISGLSREDLSRDGIMSSMLQDESCSDNMKHMKRHNWEDLEIEMDRKMVDLSIAVIAPESNETGEKIYKFILIKYQSFVDKTMGMSISVHAYTKKGKRKSAEAMSNEPAVDLRALLIQCAHAVATGNHLSATKLLYKIKQHSSPMGDATQRLAHCFSQALEARLDGTGSQLYKSLIVKLTSANEFPFLNTYQFCVSASCFKMMAFMFSNLTIMKAVAGSRRKKVHIVDYGEHYGFQWPTLLGNLATWEEGSLAVRITAVRITCIVLHKSGFRPSAKIEETGRRLSSFARRCGIPFKFRSIIVAKWEMVCAHDLNIEPDEVLIVNGIADFGRLMDESIHDIDSPSPRDMVLKNIQNMRPDVFILCIENSSYNTPFFVARFREALFYYSAMFDMMDAVAPRDNEHILFEKNVFGRRVFNAIACEGLDRVERPETYKQWQVRNERAGLRQLSLDPDIVKTVSKKATDNYRKEFVTNVDQQWFLQGWKGRILYALSTWVAKDGI